MIAGRQIEGRRSSTTLRRLAAFAAAAAAVWMLAPADPARAQDPDPFFGRLTIIAAGPGSGTIEVLALFQDQTCVLLRPTDFCSIGLGIGLALPVTLRARPVSPFFLLSWGGDCGTTSNARDCELLFDVLDPTKTVRPAFSRVPVVLTVRKAGAGSGVVTGLSGDIVCGSNCTADVLDGDTVTLRATPSPRSVFAGWTGGGCAQAPRCTTVISNRPTQFTTITAVFAPAPIAVAPTAPGAPLADNRTLVVAKTGSGRGRVTSRPAGIDCGRDCVHEFARGANVVLTAAAESGSTFTGWRGCAPLRVTLPTTCVVSVREPRTVSAAFALRNRTLAVTRQGEGRVRSVPAGIDCGSDCSHSYGDGTEVLLGAEPAAGWRFAGWSGSGCSGTASCLVTMTQARSVSATFVRTHLLVVARAGTGLGVVRSIPPGIDCGLVCAMPVAAGTTVTLTATPGPGSSFAGYSGACAGTTCTLTMDGPKAVTATFTGFGGT